MGQNPGFARARPGHDQQRTINGCHGFFLFFALGLLSPIFAVFILEKVEGSTLSVIGMAATFYWIARVTMVVPFSRLMDKIRGEKDEFWAMVIGTYAISLLPLLYLTVTESWQVYLIQFLMGTANSLAVPAWRILFTNHVSRSKVGYEWSVEDVGVGTATAVAATAGAIIAESFGFYFLFGIISVIGVVGASVLLFLHRDRKIFREVIGDMNKEKRTSLKVDGIK